MGIWTSFVEIMQMGLVFLSQVYGGNMGLAIITFSMLVRLAMLPLTMKLALRSLTRNIILKKLQPELARLRERLRKQPERLARETMEFFKSHGLKPIDLSGILGGLIQIPVFLCLYSAIRKTLRGGRFLWIKDISKPDFFLTMLVTALTYITVAVNPGLAEHNRLFIILLPAVMTMFFLLYLPAGIGLYWGSINTVNILQNVILLRKTGKVSGNTIHIS